MELERLRDNTKPEPETALAPALHQPAEMQPHSVSAGSSFPFTSSALAGTMFIGGAIIFHKPQILREAGQAVPETVERAGISFDQLGKSFQIERTFVDSETILAQALKKSATSFVQILHDVGSPHAGHSSGVLVTRNGITYVASAGHVARPAIRTREAEQPLFRRLTMGEPDKGALAAEELAKLVGRARVARVDTKRDLALFSMAPGDERESARYALDLDRVARVRQGEPIFLLGSASRQPNDVIVGVGEVLGLGRYKSVFTDRGIKSSLLIRRDARVIKGSAPANKGMSGGPGFGRDGRLLGINSFIQTNLRDGESTLTHTYSGLIPADSLVRLIDKHQASLL